MLNSIDRIIIRILDLLDLDPEELQAVDEERTGGTAAIGQYRLDA
jgi:hypothetical protein